MTAAREGALSGWELARYRTHMLICPWCRRCRRQVEEVVQLAGEIPREDVPLRIADEALAVFRGRGAAR
jgi:hypothetical protein